MPRTAPAIVLLLAICAPAHSDDKPQPKPEGPLTKEKILGVWGAKLADGDIHIEFKEKAAIVSVLAGESIGVGNLAYEFKDKSGEVLIGGAVVKAAKGGGLTISGPLKVGTTTFTLPETRLERKKPKDQK